MNTNPSNDGSNDNPDEFSEYRDKGKTYTGAPNSGQTSSGQGRNEDGDNQHAPNRTPDMRPPTGQTAGQDATVPNTSPGTPQYGEFGHAEPAALTPEQLQSRPAGNNPGGTAAPTYVEPEQRGSAPQNLDPTLANQVEEAEYDVQRDGWAQDDPRYGSGTRNWATNEPANRSTGSEDGPNRLDENASNNA